MNCPQCGHPGSMHNDAGSEAHDLVLRQGQRLPAMQPAGVMCCYEYDPNGIENWYGKICGCSHPAPGCERWYTS